MRILVVEDDLPLGTYLQRGLMAEGHQVDLVCDGEAAMEYAAGNMPDLMVLDLGLPRRDGMDVLRSVRAMGEDVSILVLTARSGLQDRLNCLDAGADDLMLKPFSFPELSARCRALHRKKTGSGNAAVLRYGALEIRRFERQVFWCGSKVELTAKEFSLLEYLMLHRGRCVDRTELLSEVWAMSPDAGTNVVDVYVNYLRRKLSNVPGAEAAICPIETVRGKGYMIGAATGRTSMPAMAFSVPQPQPSVFA